MRRMDITGTLMALDWEAKWRNGGEVERVEKRRIEKVRTG